MFGYTIQEMIGRPLLDFVPPENREFIRSQIRARVENCYEYSGLRKDGTRIPVEVSAKNFVFQGRPARIVAMRDISDRKRLEEALRRAEAELRQVFNSISDSVWSCEVDPSGRSTYHYYSPAVEKITGRPPEFYMPGPERWLSIVHPADQGRLKEVSLRIGTGQTDREEEEYRIVLPNQTIRWVRDSVVPRKDEHGIIRLHGVVSDITDRKEAEAALRRSEENFRSFVETTRDWIWTTDRDVRITYSNPAVAAILGHQPEELIGKSLLELMHGEERRHIEHRLPEWIADKTGWSDLTLRWRHKDGAYRYLESTAVPVLEAGGEVAGYQGTNRDITERKLAQDALRESEARYRDLYDEAPVGYHEIDTEGRIRRVNQSELAMLGYSAEEMLGRYVWEFVSEPDVSRQAVADKIAERIPLKPFERTLVRKDGTSIPVVLQECYLRDQSGRVIGIRTTMQDISDRKRAEEMLKQLMIKEERQKAAQKMLLVLMHEIYNPLTAVLGNAALLKDEELAPAVRECVSDIEVSAQKIDSVLRMLIKLDLSDPGINGTGRLSPPEES
jgi:PAS domain S-box-containing protein